MTSDDFDRSLARWFEAEAPTTATPGVLDHVMRATSARRPRPRLVATIGSQWVGDAPGTGPGPSTLGRLGLRPSVALLLLLLVLAVVAGVVVVGASLRLAPSPVATDLGIFRPLAGRIVIADGQGLKGIDPTAADGPATSVQLPAGAGIPLGWSSDGTRLLILRGTGSDESLSVLHADGTETLLTLIPWSIRGAAISPDGSRVVFAGSNAGVPSALFAVDADGGPIDELLQPTGDLIQQPAFSPDGTRIAFAMGGGDHSNGVWLIDADGGGRRPIVSNGSDEWPGHVRGLAWSPVGDRIAYAVGGQLYTFAMDGSDATWIAGGETTCDSADTCAVNMPKSVESPYWSPDASEIAFTTGCADGAGAADRRGCHLVIAGADGSDVRDSSAAASGPWNPAPRPTD